MLALNCLAAARSLFMARSIRISVARALASGSGTMLAPSLPLLRLPDRGTADRNPNQPITARKSHRCSLSQATKAFLDEFHEFLVHCRDNGMRYSLARFGVANAAVCASRQTRPFQHPLAASLRLAFIFSPCIWRSLTTVTRRSRARTGRAALRVEGDWPSLAAFPGEKPGAPFGQRTLA